MCNFICIYIIQIYYIYERSYGVSSYRALGLGSGSNPPRPTRPAVGWVIFLTQKFDPHDPQEENITPAPAPLNFAGNPRIIVW